MRPIPLFTCLLFAATVPAPAQEWEVGGGAGYGISRGVDISNASRTVRAGFRRGPTLGAYGAYNRGMFSGELHYDYKFSDLRVEGQGQSATLSGEVHSIHYDLLFHSREPKKLQPFVGIGAGIRYYRGTGRQTDSQVLGTFAVLTHTGEVEPLLAPVAGVKMKVSDRIVVRLDLRDFITPFPDQVITPYPRAGSQAHGWLHDFTPMVSIGVTF